jgi:amphi-Trp domain-containing protein
MLIRSEQLRMSEEVLFKSERKQSREEIADYLQTVSDKLSTGETITLRTNDEEVTLDPPPQSTFEVKVEREIEGSDTELSIEFELEWNEGETETAHELNIE